MQTRTRAPSAANARAVARPIPLARGDEDAVPRGRGSWCEIPSGRGRSVALPRSHRAFALAPHPCPHAKSSSPAPSPARSTRPMMCRTCRSRRRRSRTRRSARPRPARRSFTCAGGRRAADAGSMVPAVRARHQASLERRLNFTTGGAATMTIDERPRPALEPAGGRRPTGLMNFGLFRCSAGTRRSSTRRREYLAGRTSASSRTRSRTSRRS